MIFIDVGLGLACWLLGMFIFYRTSQILSKLKEQDNDDM